MLRLFSHIKHMSLGATDGEIGTIKDAYFDDERWTLRYLVVTTGSWLSGRFSVRRCTMVAVLLRRGHPQMAARAQGADLHGMDHRRELA